MAAFLDEVHWDDLDLFKAVVSAGSLRKAAATLGISVNTVRSRVSRLEETLETTLFRRTRNGLTLSPEGAAILDVALEMQSLSARIHGKKGDHTLARQGELTISCSEGVGEFWLTPRLASLQEKLPGLTVSLHNDFDQHRIHAKKHDVALSFTRPSDPQMIVTRIATLHFALYASERYLARFGEPTSLDDAVGHRLVIHDAPGLNANAITLFLGETAASRIAATKVNTSYSLYWAVANGIGIGALPTYVRAISRNVRPLDVPVRLRFDLWMSFHRFARSSQPVQTTIAWLRDAFDIARYPWFAEQFVHPNHFERRLEDADILQLFSLEGLGPGIN